MAEPTPKRLEELVHDLTHKRLLDGQFDESGLTLSDLRVVEESLTKSLIGIYHGRVTYPEQADGLSVNEELEPGDGALAGSEWKIDVVDRTEGSAASEKRLAEVAGYVLRDEGVEHAEISVAVVDDVEMSRLHVDFLQIEGPTDVLTFPLEGDSLEAWTETGRGTSGVGAEDLWRGGHRGRHRGAGGW